MKILNPLNHLLAGCLMAFVYMAAKSNAAQIQGVTVSGVSTEFANLATSTPDRRPASDVVGNSGLYGSTHTQTPGGTMWLTASNLSNAGGTNAFIIFDLGAVHTLDSMKVWNYNENNAALTAGRTNEGVKLADISYSTDNVTFTTNLPGQAFNIAPGTYSSFAQTIPMSGISARYVRIDVITNWAVVNAPVGLAKVRFIDNSVRPTILSASENYGSNQITLIFSEPVDPVSATNIGNYSVSSAAGTAAILSASMGEFDDRVVLHTATLANQNYSVTASGVFDQDKVVTINSNSTVPVLPELILWLRADAGITTDDSGNVVQWNDQSQFGHNALTNVAINQYSQPPTLAAGVMNGLPAVNFNGSQLMNIPHDANLAINGDMMLSLVINKSVTGVVDPISKTGGESIAYTGTPRHGYTNNLPGPFDLQLAATSGKPVWVWGNPSGGAPTTLSGAGGVTVNQNYIVTVMVHGTNVSCYLNGSFDGSAMLPQAPGDGGNPIFLGVRGDSGNVGDAGATFNGYLAEAMILRGTVTPADLVSVHNYLGNKYGISISSLAITEQPASVTREQGKTATFWVGATGVPTLTYQWKTNNVNIPGATSAVYTTPPLTPAYNNLSYTVTITSPVGTTNSTAAILTVVSDTTSPTIFSATQTTNLTNVIVTFSEAVDSASSLNVANYSLTGGSVLSATAGAVSNQLVLVTTPLDTNSTCYLNVKNVRDLFGNVMTATTTAVLPANLSIWLRADSGVVTNGSSAVYQWLDQSPNANNAVQYFGGASARPMIGSDPINGQTTLSFSSISSNYMEAASSPSLATAGDMSIYVVANIFDYSAPREILGKTRGSQPSPFDYYAQSATALRFYRGNGSVNALVTAVPPSAGSPHVMSVVMSGTNVNQFLDGLTNSSGVLSTTIADGGTPLKLGTRDDLAQFMNGNISELLIFKSALSADDRTTIDNYLGIKYFPFIISQQPVDVTANVGQTATFSVAASQGSAHLIYQWRENSINIPGATNASFTTPVLAPGDQGDLFDVIITVPGLSTNQSSTATLNVNNVPPTLVSAGKPLWQTNTIEVVFSEAVTGSTATNTSNYSLDNGGTILSASFGDTPNTIILTVSGLSQGGSYNLSVQNIGDFYGNTLASASVPVGVYPTQTALWLRADAGIVADGSGLVSEWDDQSGNANNFIAGGQPLVVSDALNGMPAVRFDGQTAYMYASSSPSLAIAGDMAIYAVVTFNGLVSSTNGMIISKDTGSLPASYDYYVRSSAVQFYRGNGSTYGLVNASNVPSANVPHLMDVTMQGNTITHRLDGKPNGSAPISSTFTSIGDNGDYVFIGERNDLVNRLKGDLAELIIVGGTVSSNDTVSIENYLSTKYGLVPLTLPSLSIASFAGNVVITWPVSSANFVLQSASELNGGTWNTLTNLPVVSGGTNSVTLPVGGTQMFYRLKK